MRPVIFALVVVLVVSHSEALRCYCGGRTQCTSNVQTCVSGRVCASITFNDPTLGYFKSCYRPRACEQLSHSSLSHGYCCSTDLCN